MLSGLFSSRSTRSQLPSPAKSPLDARVLQPTFSQDSDGSTSQGASQEAIHQLLLPAPALASTSAPLPLAQPRIIIHTRRDDSQSPQRATGSTATPLRSAKGKPGPSVEHPPSTLGMRALEERVADDALESEGEDEDEDEDGDGDEDGKPQHESDEEEVEFDDALLAKLGDPSLCRDWSKCSIQTGDIETIDIKVGDLIQLKSTDGTDWVCEVKIIRGLREDITESKDEDGHPILTSKGLPAVSCNHLYVQGAWVYGPKDLKKLKKDDRFTPKVKYLGKNELVSSDKTDWNHQSKIMRAYHQVFEFDDQYPSSASLSSHPLSFYWRKDDRMLPPFFFGDDDDEDFQGFKYIRTHFNFYMPIPPPSLPPKKAQMYTKKQKRVTKPKGPQRNPEELKLNLHSTSSKPYTPSRSQRYSPFADKWIDTADLLSAKSYRKRPTPPDDQSDMSSGDETDYESRPATSKKRKSGAGGGRKAKKGKGKGKAVEEDEAEATTPLEKLAKESIVRGGSYGLIGNSYLVTRAKELVDFHRSGMEFDGDWEKAGADLVAASIEWQSLVEERASRRGGPGLGDAPVGCEWLCPVEHRPI